MIPFWDSMLSHYNSISVSLLPQSCCQWNYINMIMLLAISCYKKNCGRSPPQHWCYLNDACRLNAIISIALASRISISKFKWWGEMLEFMSWLHISGKAALHKMSTVNTKSGFWNSLVMWSTEWGYNSNKNVFTDGNMVEKRFIM